MDKLRDFIRSWPGRILLILCLAPMVFLGLDSYFSQGRLTATQVAKVGQTPIELADVQAEANDMRVRLLEYVDASMIDEEAMMRQMLETTINRALLQEQAAALGMEVSDGTITAMLQQDEAFFDANGQFSNDVFGAYLQQRGLTRDRLFAMQKTQLNLRTLMNGVLATAIYTSPEISRLIGLQTETRQLWIKRLAWQNYADQVSITNAEIDAYYNEHQADLISPALVDLNYLQLSPSDLSEVPVTDQDLVAAYQVYLRDNNLGQKQLAQILLTGNDAWAQAQMLSQKLAAGEDFAVLAKQYSDDPSGQSGGNIGTYNPAVFGDSAAEVDAAIAKLGVGQVSEAVQTAFGVHIFQVVGADDAPSFDSLKAQLTETVRTQKQQAAFSERVFAINNMVADGFSLQDIASQFNMQVKQIANYQDREQAVMGQPVVARTAFDEFLIQDKAVSSNIEVAGTTLWLEPTNYRPSQPLTRQTAEAIVKQRLTIQKASELALADAKAQAATITPANVNSLTAVGKATRQSNVLNEAERASLFSQNVGESGLAVWAIQTDIGASVMAGSAIESQGGMDAVQRQAVATTMKNVAGQDYLEDYLHYLRTVHEVQMNEDLLKTL